ncbi:hypothetical protein ACFWN1_22135 [Streptomyces sp. NPDC058459]|uniref:hypothetical protein n=1 Tax=Streptomyces sp. NPDC058459 TaxID=3346508 RepID=UPI003650E782
MITSPTVGFPIPEGTSDVALASYALPSSAAHGRILVGAGLALLPWLGYLAGTLPPAEAAAWVALDALEAAALLTAGSRLLRDGTRHRAPAAAAALLLLADACGDLAISAPGPELARAVAMAVVAELPLAALCTALAARPGPRTRRGARRRYAGRPRSGPNRRATAAAPAAPCHRPSITS